MAGQDGQDAQLITPLGAACRRLGIGRTMIYGLIKAGELRTIKIGARTLIPEVDIQKLVADRLAERSSDRAGGA